MIITAEENMISVKIGRVIMRIIRIVLILIMMVVMTTVTIVIVRMILKTIIVIIKKTHNKNNQMARDLESRVAQAMRSL